MGVPSLSPALAHFLAALAHFSHHFLLNDYTTILDPGTGYYILSQKNKNFLNIPQSSSEIGTKALPFGNIILLEYK